MSHIWRSHVIQTLLVTLQAQDFAIDIVAWHVTLTHAYHMCDMTHSYVCHGSFVCMTWLIHMCDTAHSYVGHKSRHNDFSRHFPRALIVFVTLLAPWRCGVTCDFTTCHHRRRWASRLTSRAWMSHVARTRVRHLTRGNDVVTWQVTLLLVVLVVAGQVDIIVQKQWRIHLQCVAVCCSVLKCVAVCCRVLQCVTVCCSVLPRVAVCYRVFLCAAVCCSVLQCVAVCCSVLQCVAANNARHVPRRMQRNVACCTWFAESLMCYNNLICLNSVRLE